MKSFIILGVIVSIAIYFNFFKKRVHRFWDKQPVSRDGLKKEGRITENPKFNIMVDETHSFRDVEITPDSEEIFNFINEHFTDSYTYNNEFLYESLSYLPNSDVHNIALYDKDKIIAFIHSKPLNIYINDKLENIYYVDFLCVHKNYRGKSIATLLISKLINSCDKDQIFIFKKEMRPLPFNYINKTSYYYIDISFVKSICNYNNVRFLDKDNLEKTYQFIENSKKKKKIYQKLSYEEFLKLYCDSNKHVIIEFDKTGNIKAVLIYNIIYFMDAYHPLKTADIEYIFTDGIDNYNIMDYLMEYCSKNEIKIITLVNQLYNKYFINKYKFLPSFDLYYHMYNYHLNNKISSYDMCFNIL